MTVIEPLPAGTPWAQVDLATHSLTGWPHHGACPHCAADAAQLFSTHDSADYECRGTPTDPRSAYGPDRCGRVFTVARNNHDTAAGDSRR
jgi:hypothetical protein